MYTECLIRVGWGAGVLAGDAQVTREQWELTEEYCWTGREWQGLKWTDRLELADVDNDRTIAEIIWRSCRCETFEKWTLWKPHVGSVMQSNAIVLQQVLVLWCYVAISWHYQRDVYTTPWEFLGVCDKIMASVWVFDAVSTKLVHFKIYKCSIYCRDHIVGCISLCRCFFFVVDNFSIYLPSFKARALFPCSAGKD